MQLYTAHPNHLMASLIQRVRFICAKPWLRAVFFVLRSYSPLSCAAHKYFFYTCCAFCENSPSFLTWRWLWWTSAHLVPHFHSCTNIIPFLSLSIRCALFSTTRVSESVQSASRRTRPACDCRAARAFRCSRVLSRLRTSVSWW